MTVNNILDGGNKVLEYQVHVQDIGWMPVVSNGNIAGTTGQSKSIEAISIAGFNGVNCRYRVHVQDIGWMDWVENGNIAGTTGQCKRIEAIEIECDHYMEAQEHIAEVGWMPISSGNRIKVGTETKSLGIEAISLAIK